MIDQAIERLHGLDAELVEKGLKRHDRAHVLINACIHEGIDCGPDIVATLVNLGFNGKHAGIMLKGSIQREPVWPNWGRRECGQYFAPTMPADLP